MLQFRTYTAGDIHYLLDIDNKSSDYPAEARDWFDFGGAGGDVVVATWCGEPVGFLNWMPDVLGWFIFHVAVKPTYQHRGIGSALVAALRQNAMSKGVKWLLTSPEDPSWAKHLGFRESNYSLYTLEV